ncbi:uric acid degradation bifunctional protein TTL-like [Arachis stenosperma]|uniref:uric acid degradation bifunctional protein TTL-like n=1 Tax=Arachis stenosperma TaxID=217475 RepID=UPI0025AC3D7F|nr:uric acid degradation bifunctional protein TTL-like [Arachis stenosperma]
MVMTSPFFSLEHAITVARDIWFRKVNVSCWLETISTRSCSNQYLKMANEVTMQELHEWGSMYEKKFRYVFVTCASGKTFEDILAKLKKHDVVELNIASKEEMKYIELHITEFLSKKSAQTTDKGDVSAEYSGEIVNDTLDGVETDSEDNLDDISSGGIDISRKFELNKVLEEDNETLYT